MIFERIGAQKSRYIMHLGLYRNLGSPTGFADKPRLFIIMKIIFYRRTYFPNKLRSYIIMERGLKL